MRTIAKEAWLYAYAPLRGYKAMYERAIDKGSPVYGGGFNKFRTFSRAYTPADVDVLMPTNDTDVSWAWLDLRAEPVVFTVPAVPEPRYYANQWFDMWTHNIGYTGVRTTGRDAESFLFVGPSWKGEVPKNIRKVYRAETDFVGTLTRTQRLGAGDADARSAVEAQYTLTPLSQFLGTAAPKPAAPVEWPAWDSTKAEGIGFIGYMNVLLPFMPAVPSEAPMRARFAKIGMEAGKPFDPDTLDRDVREALQSGIIDAVRELNVQARRNHTVNELYGTRESMGTAYVMGRDIAALTDIYASSQDELSYEAWYTGPDGKWLDGKRKWVLRFGPGQLPPAKYFWSITLYDVAGQHLVDNALGRYSIDSRTPELKYRADGALELYVQTDNPGPEKAANWLPAPQSPFFLMLRMYGPELSIASGKYVVPPVTEMP